MGPKKPTKHSGRSLSMRLRSKIVEPIPPFSQLPNSISGTLSVLLLLLHLSPTLREPSDSLQSPPCSDELPAFWPVLFSLQGLDPSPPICRRLRLPTMPSSPPGRRWSLILSLLKLLSLSWLLVPLRLLPSPVSSLSTSFFPMLPSSRPKRLVFGNLFCWWFVIFSCFRCWILCVSLTFCCIWFDFLWILWIFVFVLALGLAFCVPFFMENCDSSIVLNLRNKCNRMFRGNNRRK